MPRLALLALFAVVCARADDKPTALDLWPAKPPGDVAAKGEERDLTKDADSLIAGKRLIRLGNVSKPTITVYRPAKPNGTCVIVCPGGGYHILAHDLEGTEVCQWLNRIGVTAVLLKYRVPAPPKGPRHLPALMDAQRAVSLVRSKASEWKIDPKKIGILGFSAGGHLAAVTATGEDKRAYDAIDKTDEASCRPNFAVLIYPAYLTDRKVEKLSSDLVVTKDTPPTFLAHANDDPVPAEGSAILYLALKKARVPAELHVWQGGGHGYGLRKTDRPVTAWPERCEEWLRERGLLAKPASAGGPFPLIDDAGAWRRLPLAGRDVGKPLPEWAAALAGPLPRTAAALLELDRLHRAQSPLGLALAARVRLAAARENKCAWTEAVARADLGRAGETEVGDEAVLAFARKLTTAAYSVTDEEVANLRKHLGDAKLVALVQLLAYANFQDRLVLALGVGGDVLPPLDVRVDRTMPVGEPPRRRAPGIAPRPVKVVLNEEGWTKEEYEDLQKKMSGQKAREPRIPVPTWDEVKKRIPAGAPVPTKPVGIRWSLVCSGHQPQLASAWSACTRAFGEEAKQDRVFEESLFWVVTRSITCFY